MSRTPWYRWFPSDFSGSIKVKAMSDMAELVYRRLLDALWESEECMLPEDLPFLHNVLLPKGSFDEFKAAWAEITRPGFEAITRPVEGMVSNRRIRAELEDARAMIAQKREAGRLSAAARARRAAERADAEAGASTDVATDAPTDVPTSVATGSQREGNHPHPHPHPQPQPHKETPPPKPPAPKPRFTPPSGSKLKVDHPWLDAETWDLWVEYRRELGKPIKTQVGVSQQINFLARNQDDHVAILKQSMANEWQGLFELKSNGNHSESKAEQRSKRNAQACMEVLRDHGCLEET